MNAKAVYGTNIFEHQFHLHCMQICFVRCRVAYISIESPMMSYKRSISGKNTNLVNLKYKFCIVPLEIIMVD